MAGAVSDRVNLPSLHLLRLRGAHPATRRPEPAPHRPSDRSQRMFKKLSRAGLAALVCSLVFGAFISVAAVDVSLAQATAPAAEAPAATAPPPCDAKTLKDCAPNSGDTAWMLTSVALVLMMTVPGLGLFYGGMVRKKNV